MNNFDNDQFGTKQEYTPGSFENKTHAILKFPKMEIDLQLEIDLQSKVDTGQMRAVGAPSSCMMSCSVWTWNQHGPDPPLQCMYRCYCSSRGDVTTCVLPVVEYLCFGREKRLIGEELGHDAPHCPHVNCLVIGVAPQQHLRRPEPHTKPYQPPPAPHCPSLPMHNRKNANEGMQ